MYGQIIDVLVVMDLFEKLDAFVEGAAIEPRDAELMKAL